MTTRRNFLAGAPAAALLASPALASALDSPAHVAEGSAELKALLVRHLTGELGDRAVAESLVPPVLDAAFLWSNPQIPAGDADSIIAYSFGNRFLPGKTLADGARLDDQEVYEPGPVNALLADAVHAIRGSRKIPVYAQWEIAQILSSKHGMDDVEAIYPGRDAQGGKVYLSTNGVARAAIARAGSAKALGQACVVGHRDHVKRCIIVSRNNGIAAAAARDVALPVEYDPSSGQNWTRKRDAYLLSDIIAQLSIAREQLLGGTPA